MIFILKKWLCKKSPLGKRIDSIIDHQNQIKDSIVAFFYKPKSIKHIRSIWQQKIDGKVEKQDKKELDILIDCREKVKSFPGHFDLQAFYDRVINIIGVRRRKMIFTHRTIPFSFFYQKPTTQNTRTNPTEERIWR